MATARERAAKHILGVIVDAKPALHLISRVKKAAPFVVKRRMGQAVAYWHGETIPRVPVRASRALRAPTVKAGAVARGGQRYSRVGRGMLKKSIRPFVRQDGSRIIGGLQAMTHYAIWLTAGTRRIAKGAVMAWREGMLPVPAWKAKAQGGNPRAEMPIMLPQRAAAVKRFVSGLAGEMAKG